MTGILTGEYYEIMKSKKRPMTVKEMAKLGNAARNRALTSEQRTEIARRAVNARWAKRNKEVNR